MELHLDEQGHVIDEAGYVAMSFFQEIPKKVIMPDKTEYYFIPKSHVSLAWIKPEHVGG